MELRTLGRTGVKVSPLCLGTMMLGAWGNPDHDESIRIVREVEDSLRRLRTDWIDLYQIHRPEPDTDIDEALSALTDLIRAGKVRYAGSSTFPASRIVEAQWVAEKRGRERFVCEQPPYSILAREQLESQLGAADRSLPDDVLDRIDEIVPPGRNVNPADAGWADPALEPHGRRR